MNNQGELVDLPAALFQLTTVLCLAVAAWAAAVALLASWRPTAHLARALTPRIIRAALFTTVSGTLAVGPTHAADDLDGLPYPDRGVTAGAVDATHHTVEPGESLWLIATESLPSGATPTQVAAASAAWYETNTSTIGEDPDLILPGQNLTPPDADASR